MSGNMAYVASAGAQTAFIEKSLNGTMAHKEAWLSALDRAPSLGAAFLAMNMNSAAARDFVSHIYSDFFGYTRDAAGNWQDQKPYNIQTNPTTGFWDGWYVTHGEEIFAAAVRNTLQLSLGMHNGHSTRNDHIAVLWICAVDAFEVVVQRHPNLTQVILLTPGIVGAPLTDDLAGGPFNGETDYACPPTDYTKTNALWLIGNRWVTEGHDQYYETGPVVVVQPAVEDGGMVP